MIIKFKNGKELYCRSITFGKGCILADGFCIVYLEDVERIEADQI